MDMRRLYALISLAVIVLVGDGLARADQPILRIEEDWEVVVDAPDADTNAPQISTFLFPTNNKNIHFSFDLNHASTPQYRAGGVQVQVWINDHMATFQAGDNIQVMSGDGETVRWTQAVELNGDSLQFSVTNGTSETWGEFGNNSSLRIVTPIDIEELNSYSHLVSLQNSGAGFAGNRVQSMKLLRVRRYSAAGLVSTTSVNQQVESTE